MASKRVLIISVGGSCAPVVNACREYDPDYIYFFCSGGPKGSTVTVDGPGDPCGESRKVQCECGKMVPLGNPKGKAIVYQLGLEKECYEKIEVDEPDDLKGCFDALSVVEKKIAERFGDDVEVIANYTGGTKSMSAALVLKAIQNEDWKLSLNKGIRKDLIKVRCGDVPVLEDKLGIYLENYIDQIKIFLQRHDYSAADNTLSEITKKHSLPSDEQRRVLRARRLCQAFHAWDLFNHEAALEMLRIVGGESVSKYILALVAITKENGGYEQVQDLILNAERRAVQERYDDAVARLYRAVEMVAQVRLQSEWGIDVSNVQLYLIPHELQEKYKELQNTDGRIQLALRKSYELLVDLDDPVGTVWQDNVNKVLSALNKRNASILAHGTVSLNKRDYDQVREDLVGFINKVFELLQVKTHGLQFPGEKLLEM